MRYIIAGEILALCAELDKVTKEVIERHYEASEKADGILQHVGPLDICIYGDGGALARFYKEGVEFYPEGVGK